MISLFFGISKVVTSQIPQDRINFKRKAIGLGAPSGFYKGDILDAKGTGWGFFGKASILVKWELSQAFFGDRAKDGRKGETDMQKSRCSSCQSIPSLTKEPRTLTPAWNVQSCRGKTLETSKLVQEFSTTCLVLACLILEFPSIISGPAGIGVPVRFQADSAIRGWLQKSFLGNLSQPLTNIVLFGACSTMFYQEAFWYVFWGTSCKKLRKTSWDDPLEIRSHTWLYHVRMYHICRFTYIFTIIHIYNHIYVQYSVYISAFWLRFPSALEDLSNASSSWCTIPSEAGFKRLASEPLVSLKAVWNTPCWWTIHPAPLGMIKKSFGNYGTCVISSD